MAWIWAGDPGLGSALGDRRELGMRAQGHARRPTGRCAGRIAGFVGREERGRAAAQRSIGEELQPPVVVSARIVPRIGSRGAAAKAELDGALELLLADAPRDTEGQPAGLRHGVIQPHPEAQLRVGSQATWIVDRGDAERCEGPRIGADGHVDITGGGRGDGVVDESGGRFVEGARRPSVGVPVDAAGIGIGSCHQLGQLHRPRAEPAGMVVVGPQSDGSAGCDLVEPGSLRDAPRARPSTSHDRAASRPCRRGRGAPRARQR